MRKGGSYRVDKKGGEPELVHRTEPRKEAAKPKAQKGKPKSGGKK